MQTVDVLALHRIKGIGNKAQVALIGCYKDEHLDSLKELLETRFESDINSQKSGKASGRIFCK